MTPEQEALLRDKLEVWGRAAQQGPEDLRDYNARAAEALGALLRRAKELEGAVRTLELQQQTDRQTIAALTQQATPSRGPDHE